MLETKRLILRKPEASDAADMLDIRNSEFILKYNCLKKISLEEMIQDIYQAENQYYLVEKTDKKIIGAVFIEPDSLRYQINSCTISYFLKEEYTHKGYMHEAMQAVIDNLFSTGLEVISCRVFKENTASLRLAETLGFTQEGIIRRGVRAYGDVVYDDVIFSLLKEEYIKNQYGMDIHHLV